MLNYIVSIGNTLISKIKIVSSSLTTLIGYLNGRKAAGCSNCTSCNDPSSPVLCTPCKDPSNIILKMKINNLIKKMAFERRRRKKSKVIRRLIKKEKKEKKKNENKYLAFFIQVFNCLGNHIGKIKKVLYKAIFSFAFKTRKCVSVLSLTIYTICIYF